MAGISYLKGEKRTYARWWHTTCMNRKASAERRRGEQGSLCSVR